MTPFEKIQDYARTVCAQMRWKKAHAVVSDEIENHLIDQRNAYMTDGMDENAATDQAIAQMGDPVIVGTQLDRTHRPRPQWAMVILTMIFLALGFAFRVSFYWDTGGYRWIFNLLVSQAIGLACLAGAYFMDFTWIGRHPKRLYLALLGLFVIAFIFEQPALLWINTDTLLLAFPIGFAGFVYGLKNSGMRGIFLSIASFSLPAVLPLLLEQKGLRSECVLLALCGFVILCVAVSKRWFGVKPIKGFIPIAITAVVAVAVMAVIVFSSSDRLEWVLGALNPSYKTLSTECSGWEIKAALSGSKFIGHGVMPDGSYYGIGYGFSILLTSLIYNFGWITLIPIVGMLMFFMIKGFLLCFKQSHGLPLFVSLAVMLIFSKQAVGYVAFNLGFYVLYPIAIPLLADWSSLYSWGFYFNAALIGLMLSVFHTGHIVSDRTIKTVPTRRFIIHRNTLPL